MEGIYDRGAPNNAYLSRTKKNISGGYQSTLKAYIIPGRRESAIRGLRRFNQHEEPFYPNLWMVFPSDHRPALSIGVEEGTPMVEEEKGMEKTELVERLEDIPGIQPVSVKGGVERRFYDPMMTVSKTSQVTLNQTFALMTAALAMRHRSGNEMHRYPTTMYVAPGAVMKVTEYQKNVAAVSSRFVFTECVSDKLAYGATVYIGRTYPQTGVITMWVPAKKTKEIPLSAVEDDAIVRQLAIRALQRWDAINRRIIPAYPEDSEGIQLANRESFVEDLDPNFIKHTASGVAVSIWPHLARHCFDGESRLFRETPVEIKQIEQIMINEGEEDEHPDWLPDDLAGEEIPALDKGHYRWVRGILVSGVVPYWKANSSELPDTRYPIAITKKVYKRFV